MSMDKPLHIQTTTISGDRMEAKAGLDTVMSHDSSVKEIKDKAEKQGTALSQQLTTDHVSWKSSRGDPERMDDLEKTVVRLRNALVSLEEDNLNLNKRIKESRTGSTQEAQCHSNYQTAKLSPEHPFTRDTSNEDRLACLRREKEDAERRLRQTEQDCKECARQLNRVLKRFENLKTINESLGSKNKRLATENQRLSDELTAARAKRSQEQKKELERANERCARVTLEKQQLEGRVATLQQEVKCLNEILMRDRTEGSDASEMVLRDLGTEGREPAERPLDSVRGDWEAVSGFLGGLKEENEVLREELEQSRLRRQQAERSAEGLRQEQAALELCLLTVQKERDLLQQEVRELHRDYITLSNCMCSQLRDGGQAVKSMAVSLPPSEDGSITTKQGGPKKPACCRNAAGETTVDSTIGGETIEQIRVRFEEEEERRAARRYKNIISRFEGRMDHS